MKIEYRKSLYESERRDIEQILRSSGYFHNEEIVTALELADEFLKKGTDSGYYFLTASDGSRIVGYACYGPIPCTVKRWDLYWLAVSDSVRGQGIGRILVAMTEEEVRKKGGKRIYIETSSRELYHPTRKFYEKLDYTLETVQRDYYDDDDHKCLFVKAL